MDMAEIGANIRSCRTEKNMTMEDLGKSNRQKPVSGSGLRKRQSRHPGILPHQNCGNPGNPPGEAIRYANSG